MGKINGNCGNKNVVLMGSSVYISYSKIDSNLIVSWERRYYFYWGKNDEKREKGA